MKNSRTDNGLIPEKNWWGKNWKWLLPLSGFSIAGIFMVIFLITGMADLALAYADPSLCQNAIAEANKNELVILRLGKLEPISELAMVEGNAAYSDNNQTIAVTVRVSGEKGKGKMDISADKANGKWHYKSIKIRIKETGEEIQVK